MISLPNSRKKSPRNEMKWGVTWSRTEKERAQGTERLGKIRGNLRDSVGFFIPPLTGQPVTPHRSPGTAMPVHNGKDPASLNDEELVTLDLDTPVTLDGSSGHESFFDKLKRCGNARDSTPLPWPQLSVVMVVSLSEGSQYLNFC